MTRRLQTARWIQIGALPFSLACGSALPSDQVAPADDQVTPADDQVTDTQPSTDERWWAPGETRVFPRELSYSNAVGTLTTVNMAGPTDTGDHPFFRPLGTNGRACVTCHQPADGMSLSVETIKERWEVTGGTDPLFAAFDGSDCPSLPQEPEDSHKLLLNRGLFRIARPWPPRAMDMSEIVPEFTIEVMNDPTGCNVDPEYGLESQAPHVSVYRRPRPATNLKYVTAVGFPFDPKRGLPMPFDAETGEQTSGNVMSDGRALTLKAQALDALRGHLELHAEASAGDLAAILTFEQQLYTAQSAHARAGSLIEEGAQGGPLLLSEADAGVLQRSSSPIWSDEFSAWKDLATGDDSLREFRQSVARGAELFSKRTFLVSTSAGITDIGFGSPVRNSCAFCHNMQRSGLDVAPGQIDIGTSNEPTSMKANDRASDELPLFKLTCREGARPHPYLGQVVLTHDPGYALTSGKCIDIGRLTTQQFRGLAARAPYFSQGNAKTIEELIEFYDRRYEIEFTDEEKEDLKNLLEVL